MNGRAKGKRAELEIAKLIEAWWQQLEPDCRFVRTPQSGGWHGPDVRAEFKTGGDLMTTAKLWPFSVEVKKREGWSWDNFVLNKPSPVHGWWKQCLKAAAEDDRQPMLIFGKNRFQWRVMLRPDLIRSLGFWLSPFPHNDGSLINCEPYGVVMLEKLLTVPPAEVPIA